MSAPTRRVAKNSWPYTWGEFVRYYGAAAEQYWQEAPELEHSSAPQPAEMLHAGLPTGDATSAITTPAQRTLPADAAQPAAFAAHEKKKRNISSASQLADMLHASATSPQTLPNIAALPAGNAAEHARPPATSRFLARGGHA